MGALNMEYLEKLVKLNPLIKFLMIQQYLQTVKFGFILKDFSVWKNKPNTFSIIISCKWDAEVLSLDKMMRLYFWYAPGEY